MRQMLFGVLTIATMLAAAPKAFDVVSIKPDKDGHGLDAGTQPGGRYTARNVPVDFLVMQAFGVKGFQLVGQPKWLSEEHYDIVAKADTPNQLSQDELKPLLQAILVDRFKLKFHTEMKEFPAYSLVVGKSGPKFQTNNNFLVSHSLNVSSNNGRASMTGTRMPVSALATHLTDMTGRTVIDNTGLTGDYDFKLAWTPAEAVDDTLPTVFIAVQEQLGLKLNPIKKAPVQVIVIESMEKPTGN